MDEVTAVPAGFWRRFAAHTLDLAILMLASIAVGILLGVGAVLLGIPVDTAKPPSLTESAVEYAVTIVVFWLYFALQESGWRQATIGKRLMGIEVTDVAGQRISFLRATARYFASFISWATLTIGFIMAAFTARKQALHDMMAGTLVVRTAVASTATGWILFALAMLVAVGVSVAGVMLARPYLEAMQQQASLPPVVATGERAANAVEHYAADHHALPVAIEDTDFVAATDELSPLVSLDPETARLAIALRDGSMMLVMSPSMDSTGHVTWSCNAEPDVAASYPARCAGE